MVKHVKDFMETWKDRFGPWLRAHPVVRDEDGWGAFVERRPLHPQAPPTPPAGLRASVAALVRQVVADVVERGLVPTLSPVVDELMSERALWSIQKFLHIPLRSKFLLCFLSE